MKPAPLPPDLSATAVERLIREGKIAPAQRVLGQLAREKIPRASLARYAGLARRAGLPGLALRWLVPVVRPSPRRPAQAAPSETIEYAASLIRLGATAEALALLAPFPPG